MWYKFLQNAEMLNLVLLLVLIYVNLPLLIGH